MERKLDTSPHKGYSIDNDELKYMSGLSTILVATIQEVKDRVSQIEYIFCSQLFPNFQSKSKSLQKIIAEVRRAAEDDWRKKESSLLLQIEELRLEKIQALEQNRALVASLEQEKAKSVSFDSVKASEDEWRKKETSLSIQITELQVEKQKSHDENQYLAASLKQEKAKLLDNERLLNDLERVGSLHKNEIADLQSQVKRKTEQLAEGQKAIKDLFHQIELKDHELVLEKKKIRNVTDAFKRLKSQYNFLLSKSGLSTENVLHSDRVEHESKSPTHLQNPRSSKGSEVRDPGMSKLSSEVKESKDNINLQQKLEDNRAMSIQNTAFHTISKSPSTSSSSRPLRSPASVKSEPRSGMKRPASSWRETRARQEPGGVDPHDDFLDTPLENIKDNISKVPKEEVHDLPVPPPKDMTFDSSDDETQDLSAEPAPGKQPISITRHDGKSFKYVESVRKKADRENLKGVECKQCKKFYDAVLPEGDQNGENNKNNFRCEHHDGVSRHRYRYLPPSTPEGFWNIGFDSEL